MLILLAFMVTIDINVKPDTMVRTAFLMPTMPIKSIISDQPGHLLDWCATVSADILVGRGTRYPKVFYENMHITKETMTDMAKGHSAYCQGQAKPAKGFPGLPGTKRLAKISFAFPH